MGVLLDKLAEKKLLVSDGAWGTMLQAAGLPSGQCCEEWNVSHPDEVRAVAEQYVAAGSDLVLTNTFGGSRLKLEKSGLADRTVELNAAGAKNSLAGAGGAIVAGSVGPTGEFVEPLGTISASQMQDVFAEQIGAMLTAGLRAICVETMSAIEEAAAAVRAARALDADIDIICTFSFDKTPNGYRTMMGVAPADAAAATIEAGADIVGSNCGHGIEEMIGVAEAFRECTDRPILIHANAGLPQLVEGKTVFLQSPEDMACRVAELVAAGANIIGGCCGTTPAHITAIQSVVESL